MDNVENNSIFAVEFEAINDSYYKGVVRHLINTLYGLYTIDKEEILAPQYISIELIHQSNYFNVFHVVDAKGLSYLFVDKPRTLLLIGEYSPNYTIKLECCQDRYCADRSWDETVFTIKKSIEDCVFNGALLITEDSAFLQVPVHYDKLIFGHFYIAAFEWMYDSYNVFIYNYYNEDKREKKLINEPLHIPSEIKPEFEAFHNIVVGYNEPYPIINGKIYLLGGELFDLVLPVDEENPYCIVMKNGKYGLWEERHKVNMRAELVVDCEYDSITPYKASCPCSSDHSTLEAFSLERDGMWGVYYRRVFIPEVFEIQPKVVSSIGKSPHPYDEDYWSSEPMGFICSRNNRCGVINMSGKVIIPFRYECVCPVGYMTDDEYPHSKVFYKAMLDGEFTLFDSYGKKILGAAFTAIDIFQCYITVLNHLPELFCFFICRKDGFLGLLDRYANVLLPFEYEEMVYNKDRHSIFVKKQRESEYEEIKPDMSFVHYNKYLPL